MTIDCVSRHTVSIYDRGGRVRLSELVDVAGVTWNRVRDDISEANITLTGRSCEVQNELLTTLRSSRHEIVIHRGDERVWEGPISRLTGTRSSFEIHARDVLHYAARTTMRAGYNNAYPNIGYVIDRAYSILVNELNRKEALTPAINVLPHVVRHQKPTDAKTSAKTNPYQYQVWEHVDSLAARGGLDYTVVGRAIHLWDVHEPLSITPVLTQADILGDITVTEYGMELATITHATDGKGLVGTAGGNDLYYGEVELLYTSEDEEENPEDSTPEGLRSQALRNLAGRNPTPVIVRVPDNSTLNPNGVLRIQDLVPGVWIPVQAEVVGFNISQMQKLDEVTVRETGEGENISVRLSPATEQPIEPL